MINFVSCYCLSFGVSMHIIAMLDLYSETITKFVCNHIFALDVGFQSQLDTHVDAGILHRYIIPIYITYTRIFETNKNLIKKK